MSRTRRGSRACLAVLAVVAVLGGCGRSEPETKAATEGTTTTAVDGAPAANGLDLPHEKVRLLCPPALLDLSGLELPDGAKAEPDHETMDRYGAQPAPYQLTWKQGGRTIQLAYPGPQIRTADLPPNESVELPDGRSVRIEYRGSTTADVTESDRFDCHSFWISVDLRGTPDDPQDQARGFVIEIAKAVHIRAPKGEAKVPDVVGMSPVEAQDRLARAGFILGGKFADAFALDLRNVASQTPKAGTSAAIGSEVATTLTPQPTTTTAPPVKPNDVRIPLPTEPMTCPFSRLRVDDTFYSQPTVSYGQTIQWRQDDMYEPMLSWPNWESGGYRIENDSDRDETQDGHGVRHLEINGRPALMHDGGDGQNLVFDTGLPGACQFMQIGVFGGPVIKEREQRAIELATNGITIAPPPTAEPPNVVGKTVAEAADVLARAGFIPDWGARRDITEEPAEPPSTKVNAQNTGDDGVVQLTVGT